MNEDKFFTFDCGCKFKILSENGSIKIDFTPSIENLNLECSKTWDLISSGNTKGCFQLESRLGQSMAKKLKPVNIQQLSALIAILRPGCLEAIREGKSISNHYIDRKNQLESIDYFHPILESVLQDTFGEMIYQEQAMEISRVIAGFNLQEADELRKSIGKKNVQLMAKVKTKFLEGCKNQKKVSQEEAEEIFGWIEKSQRYSFNKSHSISYAINAYLSAYSKAHFPKIFFASYLRFAKDKIDPKQEIKELVKNANEMDISINIPNFKLLNKLFILKDKRIYFGLTDIKGVGDSVFQRILDISKSYDINNLKWLEICIFVLLKLNSIASKALISCGAFDYFKKYRTEMLFEYELLSELTDKELEFVKNILANNDSSLEDCFYALLDKPKLTSKRKNVILNIIKSIKNPPYSLEDKIEWLSDSEETLLGTAISCSKLDSYDISMTNTDCKQFKNSPSNKNVVLAAVIDNINVIKTKKGKLSGQEMAFVTISDQYGSLDSVVFFPESYAKYKHNLFENNILVFLGSKGKSEDSLIVEKCFMPAS
jgi:DNA polymerase-3 subunit alpha